LKYVEARTDSDIREWRYRNYVADCLMIATDRTKTVTTRFEDLINPKPVDTRTGEEIAADVIKRAGLIVRPTAE
jgi:hypothetical protein